MAKIDWDKWRRVYVVGADDVTLPSIALIPGAPSLPSLKRVCAAELWADQRKRFRTGRDTLAIRDDTAAAAVIRVEKIIDAAEMMTRHTQAARLAGSKAIASLREIDPATLSVREAMLLLTWSVETERLIEGLATQRQEINVTQLTDAELDALEAQLSQP